MATYLITDILDVAAPAPYFSKKIPVDLTVESLSLSEKDSGHGSSLSLIFCDYPGQDLSDDEFSQEFSISSPRRTSIHQTSIDSDAIILMRSNSIPITPPHWQGITSNPPPAPPPPPVQFFRSGAWGSAQPQIKLYSRTSMYSFSSEDLDDDYIGDCMTCNKAITSPTNSGSTGPLLCKDCARDALEQEPMEDCIVCYAEVNESRNKRICCSKVVCKDCIKEIVRTSIEDEGKTYIQCPNLECKKGVIGRSEILPLLSSSTKGKYEQMRLQEIGSNDKKTCPNCCFITEHKLPSRFSRYREENVRITCSECRFVWCFRCHTPWHKDLTCKQSHRGQTQFKEWTKSRIGNTANCQMCPLCRVYIQRSTGCDHMTCNRCNTNFCYKCGGLYSGIPGLGDHHTSTSVWGCKYNYKPNSPVQRKTVRGGYLGTKLAMLTGYPVLFVAGVAVVVVVGAVALPIYGGYRFYKYKKNTKKVYRRKRH